LSWPPATSHGSHEDIVFISSPIPIHSSIMYGTLAEDNFWQKAVDQPTGGSKSAVTNCVYIFYLNIMPS
jgi:hypothetical protein